MGRGLSDLLQRLRLEDLLQAAGHQALPPPHHALLAADPLQVVAGAPIGVLQDLEESSPSLNISF